MVTTTFSAIFVLSVFINFGTCADDFYFGTFPKGFKWGVSTSNYQNGEYNRKFEPCYSKRRLNGSPWPIRYVQQVLALL